MVCDLFVDYVLVVFGLGEVIVIEVMLVLLEFNGNLLVVIEFMLFILFIEY